MPDKVTRYRICIKGYFRTNWSEWLHSFQVKSKRNGEIVLTGNVVDQSALQGLLDYLFDMGITIISIERIGRMSLIHHWFIRNLIHKFYDLR